MSIAIGCDKSLFLEQSTRKQEFIITLQLFFPSSFLQLLLDKLSERGFFPQSFILHPILDRSRFKRQYNGELLVGKPLHFVLHGIKRSKHHGIVVSHGLCNFLENGLKVTTVIIKLGVEKDNDVLRGGAKNGGDCCSHKFLVVSEVGSGLLL